MKILLLALAIAATPATTPARAAAPHGTLIDATAIAGAPGGARGYRIRYTSRDKDNRPITVTGVVVVPTAPAPKAGRDTIAWAHGTTGIAEKCAPSAASWLWGSIPGLDAMLAGNRIVVAPDYQGLGSPGPHPYLVGEASARTVLDGIRAARQMKSTHMTGRFAVWGESQGGHAALWTGRTAAHYAPDLDLVAVAATAPPTDLTANLTGGSNAAIRAFLTAYTAESWSKVYDIRLPTIVRPVGADLIHRIAANCVSLDGFKLGTKIGLARLAVRLKNVDIAASPRWAVAMKANSVPATGFTTPVLIVQGGKDQIVAPAVTRKFTDRLCRARVALTRIEVPGGDHIKLAKTTAPTTLAWIGDRFDGATAPNDC